ncbi:hypothetical protein SPRG_04160 [Saprolegnia parasitica CBS 223.65]|uniref:tRNA (guanine(9)-N(1))-methyltransferase n=1 Tax=Saprolegnia parasitica (strain CBS 223.65) TaxID=695850 RepID=A0A067CVZ0_SAPPC|nr:hypothetical protein SPRG_04160 [Saprolegnia parasitica CBS 223.65]KDO30972.1 hypothetical protein SPRG_04160 [Saprolegnia parasitica CBS 223.65]|eukprot:XP_012198156.1 hypothetical protein SPRG_04160 [Saprolegnia parasitica CBS 223.65]
MQQSPWTVAAWVGAVLVVATIVAWVQDASDEVAAQKKRTKQQRRQERIDHRRAAIDARRRDKKLQHEAERQASYKAHDECITQEEKQMRYDAKIAQKQLAKTQLEDKLNYAMATGLRVVVDLSFLRDQTPRERHSVIKQVACVYGAMKKSELPSLLSLHLASYEGDIAALCDKRGASAWKVTRHAAPIEELFPGDTIVLLSPDSPNVLTELDPATVYVVGGIVDRTVRKSETMAKAAGVHRITTARLPVQETCSVRSHVLNIDTVLLALMEVANHGDWHRAFEATLPKRFFREAKE